MVAYNDQLIENEYSIAQSQFNVKVDEIFDNQYAKADDNLLEQKQIAKHYFNN